MPTPRKPRKNKPQKGTRQRVSQNTDWRPAFLAAFELTGVVLTAADAVGVNPRTVHCAKKHEPEFATAFEESRQIGAQLLIKEATRRAVQGLRRMKFFKGQPIIDPETGKPYFEHEYSDTLMLALLKRHFPSEFRENSKVEHSGEVNGTLTVLSEAEATRLRDARRGYLLKLNGEAPESPSET